MKIGREALLSTPKCSICRYQKRPLQLKDMARALEVIAQDMRFAHDNPYYDPHGFTTFHPLNELLNKYLKSIHIGYRKTFISEITKGVDLDEKD